MRREVFDMSKLREKISAVGAQESDEHTCCSHEDHAAHALQSLPLSVRRRLHALEKLQLKRSDISAEFRRELLQLERKFLKKYEPLGKCRSEIVSGVREPTSEELADFDASGVEEVNEEGAADEAVKGIPLFWLTVLGNHPDISALITEEDSNVLECLQDVRMTFLEGKPGFRLEFDFAPNEYFSNKVLNKEYHLAESETPNSDDYVYDYAVGTEINWKPGKNLCFKTVVRTQRHRTNNSTRTIKREEKLDSFFHFFIPPVVPDQEEDAEDENDDDADELESRLQYDYEIGEIVKEHIVPNAVDWFTGKALDYVEFEDDQGYSGDEYDEDDEDEEEDEDEEDEDDEDEDDGAGSSELIRKPSKPSARTQPKGLESSGEKPECKQQ